MIHLTITDGLAEVVLDAPKKLNAVDSLALQELTEVLRRAAQPGVRALVLRGEGRGFCAGRDVSGVDPEEDDVQAYLGGLFTPLARLLVDFPAPTFAAVQGPCLGVGLGLALACDVVYVADDARFGSPFVNLGAVLDSGAHELFVSRLGVHRTLDLVYTGELISGADAVAAGLFSRSMPADELLEFTRATARRVADGPTRALLASKRIVNQLRGQQLWQVMEWEADAQAGLAASRDYREGFAAFQQKRRPEFTGE